MKTTEEYTKSQDELIEGPKVAVKILNALPAKDKDRLLNALKLKSPQAFSKISASIFRYEDIPNIIGNGLQILVREVFHEDLVLALKHSSFEIRNCFFENMSSNKRNVTIEDMELVKHTPEEKISLAKNRIVQKIDELRTAGIIRTASSDDVWV